MSKLQVIPIGGSNEIGKNCNLVIQDNDMIVIDCGISFPTEEMHGVDVVIPDFTYIIENQHKLKGIFLTHAHEDHIGALPYLLSQVDCPIYGTKFTIAMVKNKIAEKIDIKKLTFIEFSSGDIVEVGKLSVEPIQITHSIPENCSLAVRTKYGIVLFTSDFKFDFTPVDNKLTDINRLTELSDEGVLLLMSDSTNVDRPGWSPSESVVCDGLKKTFLAAKGRVLITTFSSNIHRMQQVFDAAKKTGRKVAIAGRRMEQSIDLCQKMGYVNIPSGVRIKIDQVSKHKPEEVVIISTGSQGEPLSALVQMSKNKYSRLKIRKGDTILYSARPIPGNEAAIWRTVNRLFRMGAEVIYDSPTPIHVSGHGHQEELKMMINLTRPYYVAPIHGEARHQYLYKKLLLEMGYPSDQIFELQDGTPLSIDAKTAWTEKPIECHEILVGKNGIPGITEKTMREREALSNYGVAIVNVTIDKKNSEIISGPEITTQGFLDDPETLSEIEHQLYNVIYESNLFSIRDSKKQKHTLKQLTEKTIYKIVGLKPSVIPLIQI